MKTKRLLSVLLTLTLVVSTIMPLSVFAFDLADANAVEAQVSSAIITFDFESELYTTLAANGTELRKATGVSISEDMQHTDDTDPCSNVYFEETSEGSGDYCLHYERTLQSCSSCSPANGVYSSNTSNNVTIPINASTDDAEYYIFKVDALVGATYFRNFLNFNYKPVGSDGGLNPEGTETGGSHGNGDISFISNNTYGYELNSGTVNSVSVSPYCSKWSEYTFVIDAFGWNAYIFVDDTYIGHWVIRKNSGTAGASGAGSYYISGIKNYKFRYDRTASAPMDAYIDNIEVYGLNYTQLNAADLAQGIATPSGTIATGAVLDTVTPVTNKTITWTTNNSGVTVDENGVVYVSPSVTDGTSVEFTATFDYATGDVTKVYTATVSTDNSAEITDVSQLFDIYKNKGAYVQAVYDADVNQMNPSAEDYTDISNKGLYAHNNQHVAKLGNSAVASDGYTPNSNTMYLYTRDEVEENEITFFPYSNSAYVNGTTTYDVTAYNYFGRADNRTRTEESTDVNGVTKAAWTNYTYFRDAKPGSQQMVFGLDDGGDYITTSDSNLTIFVEYLDQTAGNISMTYWSTADARSSATSIIPGTGSGEWKTAVFKLSDAKFYEYSDFSGTGLCDGRCDFNISTPKGTGGKMAISRAMIVKSDDINVDTKLSIASTIPTGTILPVETSNFALPVTWTSDNENVKINNTTGTVTVTASNGVYAYENVTLTANYGVITQEFTVTATAPSKYAEYKFGYDADKTYGMDSYNVKFDQGASNANYYSQIIDGLDVRNTIIDLGSNKTFYYIVDDPAATSNTAASHEVTKEEYDAFTGLKQTYTARFFNTSNATGDSAHNRYEAIGPEGDKRPAVMGVSHLRNDSRLSRRSTPSMIHFNATPTFTSADNALKIEVDIYDVGSHKVTLQYRNTASGTTDVPIQLTNTGAWKTFTVELADADFSKDAATTLGSGAEDFRFQCGGQTFISAVRVYTNKVETLEDADYTTVALRDYDVAINLDGTISAKEAITAEQAADAKLYIAVYDAQGDLVEVATSAVVTDGAAATINTADTLKRFNPREQSIKTFLWDSDLKPYR